MKVRRATIEVGWDVLRRALHMPDTCDITGGRVSFDWGCPTIILCVEDNGLPEVELAEGQPPPPVSPIVTYIPESWEWRWDSSDGANALPGVGE